MQCAESPGDPAGQGRVRDLPDNADHHDRGSIRFESAGYARTGGDDQEAHPPCCDSGVISCSNSRAPRTDPRLHVVGVKTLIL